MHSVSQENAPPFLLKWTFLRSILQNCSIFKSTLECECRDIGVEEMYTKSFFSIHALNISKGRCLTFYKIKVYALINGGMFNIQRYTRYSRQKNWFWKLSTKIYTQFTELL